MKKKNVLIFPIGSENGINIFNSIKYNLHFGVFGASGHNDHAEYIVPSKQLIIDKGLYINNEEFFEVLNNIIRGNNIDFLIPTHDTISCFLMKYKDKVEATIICSPYETAEIAEDKYKQYEYLKYKSYYPEVYDKGNVEFPVFLKPFVSAGGKGTVKVTNEDELKKELVKREDLLICEYLPGEECTVDCFTNKSGELLFVGARTRERITNGISYLSRGLALTDEIYEIASDLNNTFRFRGAWFFQIKKDFKGRYKLLEFSVRQAGTMAYYRQLGVNFTLLSLFDFMDLPVKVLSNNISLTLDRGIETLYRLDFDYNTIYLDYDDTLIINNMVNVDVIKLIYQAHNQCKKVVLLTKHIGDLNQDFLKYRLAQSLFDEIQVIEPDKRKADYITEPRSILIDNYFPERLDVYERCNIPVFDVDAVECLIDKRVM